MLSARLAEKSVGRRGQTLMMKLDLGEKNCSFLWTEEQTYAILPTGALPRARLSAAFKIKGDIHFSLVAVG